MFANANGAARQGDKDQSAERAEEKCSLAQSICTAILMLRTFSWKGILKTEEGISRSKKLFGLVPSKNLTNRLRN